MKTPTCVLLLALICLLINGCIYESKVSIDTPSIKLNPELIGSWKVKNTGDQMNPEESNGICIITGKTEFLYDIELRYADEQKSEHYAGYISMINNTTFLNVYDDIPKGKPAGYSFFKIEILNKGSFKALAVTGNIRETFNSSKDLKGFISENMTNSFFFELPYLFSRIETK